MSRTTAGATALRLTRPARAAAGLTPAVFFSGGVFVAPFEAAGRDDVMGGLFFTGMAAL